MIDIMMKACMTIVCVVTIVMFVILLREIWK
jgi:hypothetical protein